MKNWLFQQKRRLPMHNEMIQPSRFGIIGRTCIASVLMIAGVFTLM
ncbi:hypothetical protein Vc3S01_A0940 [Vibrio campbellii]|nr:hypothetical protein Vc3S01_A0940 [Vibrio campbellii]EDL69521.1 conserved hypothetical protein [Vibrio campbellii HY01]